MDAVLHGLHAGRAEEFEIRPDTLGGAQYRMIAGYLVQSPVHRLVPEPGHGPRIRAFDDYYGDRPGVQVDRPRLQHAELVAFRVGEDRPRDVALAHVDRRRAEVFETRDQVRLMGRGGGGEVDVHTVLHRFGFRDTKDVDAQGDGVGVVKALGLDAGRTGFLGNDLPAKRLRPEPAERGV